MPSGPPAQHGDAAALLGTALRPPHVVAVDAHAVGQARRAHDQLARDRRRPGPVRQRAPLSYGLGQQVGDAPAALAEVVVAEREAEAGVAGRVERLAGDDRPPWPRRAATLARARAWSSGVRPADASGRGSAVEVREGVEGALRARGR